MNDNTVVNLDKVYKIYRGFIDDGLLEDRLEYGEEDLQSAYPFLNKEEVKYLYRLVQSNGDPGLVSSLDEVPAGLIKECLQESIHSGHDGMTATESLSSCSWPTFAVTPLKLRR
jgi:hypothetical protein